MRGQVAVQVVREEVQKG